VDHDEEFAVRGHGFCGLNRYDAESHPQHGGVGGQIWPHEGPFLDKIELPSRTDSGGLEGFRLTDGVAALDMLVPPSG